MALIMGKPIDENGYVDIHILKENYPKLCSDGVKLLVFVNKIYNKKYKITKIVKKSLVIPIKQIKMGYASELKLDLSNLMIKYGIPRDYYVELTVTNFGTRTGEGTALVPIFPNEMILDCDYGIRKIIEENIESIKKVAEAYEVIGKLYHVGLETIAEDMREAILRLEKGDIDGAIKFFRKSIEGFKKFISKNRDILKSENRAEALKDYLTKAYHLLSNFGEHAGTEALMNEAILSKSIALSIAKYLVEILEEE